MDRSWIPTVAGILDIIAGVFALFGFLALTFGCYVVGSIPEANEFPLPAVSALLASLAIGVLITGLLAIIGGTFALRRKRWGWALAGSIAATLCFPPLGIPAIVLTVLAEKDLRSTEQLD
jgi:hypothetical protein